MPVEGSAVRREPRWLTMTTSTKDRWRGIDVGIGDGFVVIASFVFVTGFVVVDGTIVSMFASSGLSWSPMDWHNW